MRILKILFFITLPIVSFAQVLKDNWSKNTIKLGLQAMYNFDFKESAQQFGQIKSKYPAHPAGYLLSAMQLEWQYFPLKDHPQQSKTYIQLMEKCFSLSENMFNKNESDLDAAFFCSASLGFLAAEEANNDNFLKAVSYAKKAYHFLKIGTENVDKQPEFLYAAGIYHFYRIVYPELHPIIKPFMWFFMDGNKKLGLQQLEKAGKESIFVKNEALFYLPYVYNKYEGTPMAGLEISEELTKAYPENIIYSLQRAELLTLSKNFEDAAPYLNKLIKSRNKYFEGCYYALEGLILENQKEYKQAEAFYIKSTFYPFEEKFTKDIRGLSYLGLARIHLKSGQKQTAKKYLHLAERFIEYKNSKEELERLKKIL
jgi:hypothetical protein